MESISLPVYPAAYIDPTTAPMLVPTIKSGTTPSESSTRSTPIWANPFAPPPESTSAVRAGAQLPIWARAEGAANPASSAAVARERRNMEFVS